MKKIVLSGYYGFGNAGDEAMLESILQATRASAADAEIVVISGNPIATACKHSVKAVYIFNLLAIIKELRGASILLSGGGSLLQNVTSWRSFYYYLLILALGKLFACKVMLFAQGIGPIIGAFPKKVMRYIVNHVDYITVRDEGSYYELREAGIVSPPVEITADAVLGMQPSAIDEGRLLLRELGIGFDKPIVAFAPRRWGSSTKYIKAMAEAADNIIENEAVDIVFIPMHLPDDRRLCVECAALMRNRVFIIQKECSASTFMSVIGNCGLLVGVRLHALIFSAMMNTPSIAISYDPKIDRFMHSVGMEVLATIQTLNGLKLAKAVKQLLESNASKREALAATMAGIRAKALRNTYIAMRLMNGEIVE